MNKADLTKRLGWLKDDITNQMNAIEKNVVTWDLTDFDNWDSMLRTVNEVADALNIELKESEYD